MTIQIRRRSRKQRSGAGRLTSAGLAVVAVAALGTPRALADSIAAHTVGVDVSHHAGAVEWTEVQEAGYRFAYVKATEGVDLLDSAYRDHWRTLGDLGLVRGAYHFFVTEDDPDEQADWFIQNVELAAGDLVPVVDIELIGHGTQPGIAGRLHRFLERLEAHYGVRPLVYTMSNFWNAHLDDSFGDYDLWIAEYGTDAPRLPASWTAWTIWQYQGDFAIPGVEKGADVSRLAEGVLLEHLQMPARSP